MSCFAAKLRNSKFGNDEDIDAMLESFERSAKPVFKSEGDSSCIKFGSARDKDPSVGIRSGQLVLSGYADALDSHSILLNIEHDDSGTKFHNSSLQVS